jgi:hypothetical protein
VENCFRGILFKHLHEAGMFIVFTSDQIRVSTGLENPGKSLNWKKEIPESSGKFLKISRSP